MPTFYVVKYPTTAQYGKDRELPKIVTDALPRHAADTAVFSLNEAEGRSTDGPVRYRYDLVEALASA
jgi:hypothetical protein